MKNVFESILAIVIMTGLYIGAGILINKFYNYPHFISALPDYEQVYVEMDNDPIPEEVTFLQEYPFGDEPVFWLASRGEFFKKIKNLDTEIHCAVKRVGCGRKSFVFFSEIIESVGSRYGVREAIQMEGTHSALKNGYSFSDEKRTLTTLRKSWEDYYIPVYLGRIILACVSIFVGAMLMEGLEKTFAE